MPKIYAPTTWSSGSSIYHLDENRYSAGNSNSLMSPTLNYAESIHSPGEIGLTILQDIGWDVNRLVTVTSPAKGEIVLTGGSYTIKWTDNLGGTDSIILLKDGGSGSYVPYLTLGSKTSVVGALNVFTWNVSTSLPLNVSYKIQIGNVGVSSPFAISNSSVAPPTVTPVTGNYVSPLLVSVSAPAGSSIYYTETTNGSEPDTANGYYWVSNPGGLYTHASVGGISRFKFFAIKNNVRSAVVEYNYNLFAGVRVRQTDSSGTSFGSWSRWESNQWKSYPDTSFIRPQSSESWLLKAQQSFKPGTTQKFQYWSYRLGSNYKNHGSVTIDGSTPNVVGQFTYTQNATVQAKFDGVNTPGSYVNFKDPWRIDFTESPYGTRNRADSAIFSQVNYSQNNVGTATIDSGIFLNQSYSGSNPMFYSVKVPTTQTTTTGISGTFSGWTGSNVTFQSAVSTETGVVFNASGAIATANYKGHMATGRPDLADAKNQRRVVSSSTNNNWAMVYESMGDVWITTSFDAGVNWKPEVRLNITPGGAKNPTVSNVLMYDGYVPLVLVSWIEGSVLHFQTIQLFDNSSGPYWGWGYYADGGQNSNNHITINQIPSTFNGFPFPTAWPMRSDARPVVQLSQNGNTVEILVAFEKSGSGVSAAKIIMTNKESGFSSASLEWDDGNQASGEVVLSSRTDDKYPVIIDYPSVYGYPAGKYIFYLAGGYASGSRVARFDYIARTTSVLSNPNSDYTYYSIQGAVSPGNANYCLVTEAQSGSGNRLVNLYYHPIYYGSTAPSPGTVFTNMQQPAVMEDQGSGFGTSFSGAIVMKSTADNNFYQYNGSVAQISSGVNVAAVFAKERTQSGDRTSVVIKTTTSPAILAKYSGSGLAKSSGNIATNSKAVRIWNDTKGTMQRTELDFRDAIVETIDSLETGNSLFAVKSEQWPTTIAVQTDSLQTPLGITLLRNGKRIQSYQPFAWKSISSADIPGIASGDILLFTVGSGSKTASFRVVEIQDGSFQKGGLSSNLLIPTEKNIDIFPNPFNPTTTFRVSLPEPTNVRLSIFNMLGQHVATVVDGEVQAGYNDFRFNGSSLSSGIYFYRLEMGKEVKSGKLMLLK